jgi:hypothetical protein
LVLRDDAQKIGYGLVDRAYIPSIGTDFDNVFRSSLGLMKPHVPRAMSPDDGGSTYF